MLVRSQMCLLARFSVDPCWWEYLPTVVVLVRVGDLLVGAWVDRLWESSCSCLCLLFIFTRWVFGCCCTVLYVDPSANKSRWGWEFLEFLFLSLPAALWISFIRAPMFSPRSCRLLVGVIMPLRRCSHSFASFLHCWIWSWGTALCPPAVGRGITLRLYVVNMACVFLVRWKSRRRSR